MLSNERYVGDSLWQKTYMTDAFPPVMVRNRGEKEMYYAEATHPAIITDVYKRQTAVVLCNIGYFIVQSRRLL